MGRNYGAVVYSVDSSQGYVNFQITSQSGGSQVTHDFKNVPWAAVRHWLCGIELEPTTNLVSIDLALMRGSRDFMQIELRCSDEDIEELRSMCKQQ
jgi:hypothetical protein